MGIKQLSKVIGDNAPRAIAEHPLKNYFGRKIVIDASMSIYQFLIGSIIHDKFNLQMMFESFLNDCKAKKSFP